MSSGVFELADPSGKPAGFLEVTLRWKCTYCPSPGVTGAAEEPRMISEHHVEEPVDPNPEQANVEAEKKNGRLDDVEEMLQVEMKNLTKPQSKAAAVSKVKHSP